MTNPQLEDGYTRIANELLEAMARINLSGYQSRVLMAIWRQTYGWHKKEDYISVSQIARMTGIDKRNVSRTLKELIEKNMIRKNGRMTAFNKNYNEWRGLRRKGIDLDTPSSSYINGKATPLNENHNESEVLDGKDINLDTPKDGGVDLDTGGISLDDKRVSELTDTKDIKDILEKKAERNLKVAALFSFKEEEKIKTLADKYELTPDEISSFKAYMDKIRREEGFSFDVARSS
ncbi:MAG TPA: replication protein, partial [Desulfatiglandales bacterium]|nr:replication protein [Desulfatiglandales bacterium]